MQISGNITKYTTLYHKAVNIEAILLNVEPILMFEWSIFINR